jgi:hypothetical protein
MASALREAVKTRFYPFAELRGFVRATSTNPLFTVFPRATAQVSPSECSKGGRLLPRDGPFLRHWFHSKRPWLQVIASGRRFYEPYEVVQQLIDLFPELEAWWAQKGSPLPDW